MRTEIGIDVAASPGRILALCRDVAAWPTLLPHYRAVHIQGRRADRIVAQMVAMRPFGPFGIPVSWRAEQWVESSDPTDLRLRFRHVRGVTRGMDVTWHIRPSATGSRVTIEHEFQRPLPLLGDRVLPAFVDRFFTRPIAGRTLARFKQLAEERG